MTCNLSRSAPAISPIFVAALVTASTCFGQQQAVVQPGAAPAAVKAGTQAKEAPTKADIGLPTFLLEVPAGDVWLGLTAEQLLEVALQSVNPLDPNAATKEPAKVERALKHTASELGHTRTSVDAFYLGKWPITNKEYKVFVEKTGHRFPYHWWREGCKDDYEQRIQDIQKQFPKDGVKAALYYWQANWKTDKLPFKLQDENGKSIEDKPVTFISYRDATAFAGWLGMRLPSEKELTRAVKGDADIVWPWGAIKDGPGDKLTPKALDLVMLKNMRDQRLKRVGEVQATAGPFGHLDMTGNVWVYTGDIGFEPLCDRKDFEGALKDLQKKKLGQQTGTPLWKGGMAVLKGGSFLSGGDPVQLHIDSRVPMDIDDVVRSVGLRLAKSLRPGYDMIYSLIRSNYKTGMFANGQEPNLAQQIGMERYDFGADGFPQDYQAISFAPVNWITNAKSVSLKGTAEGSMVRPMVIGTFATSVKLLTPELAPGIYTVAYRNKGMPKELVEALKVGHKEVQAALKKKDADKEPKDDGADKGEKKDDWRAVLTRFGLTEKDLEPKDAREKLKFIRIGTVEVSTEDNLLLFYDNEETIKAVLPLRFESLPAANGILSTLEVGEAKVKDVARMQVKLHLGVQLDEKNKSRMCEFPATLVLDLAPVTEDKAWRLPPPAK